MFDDNRVFRAMNEAMYLVSAHKAQTNWLFFVMGSRGQVYKLVFTQRRIVCACPDFNSHDSHCKHIYFIVFRVLKVTRDSWNGAWTPALSEALEGVMQMRTEAKRKRKRLAEEESQNKKSKTSHRAIAHPKVEARCIICFLDLANAGHPAWTCSICERAVAHESCANTWFIRSSMKQKTNPRCPNCNKDINDVDHESFKMELHQSKYDPFLRLNTFTR